MLPSTCSQSQQCQGSADNPSVEYPSYIRPDVEELSYTHFGQFGLAEDLEMYAWPLLWTNSYTGKYKDFR